jgi:Ulp1 family protease
MSSKKHKIKELNIIIKNKLKINLHVWYTKAIYDIEFEANEWKTVISSDCLQQNDGHNCGIFVTLNLAAMFIGNQLLKIKKTQKKSDIGYMKL